MKTKASPLRPALFAMLIGAACPLAAQEPEIVLVCGGIGIEESLPMRQAQQAHSLTILFSTRDGGYVTDVRTSVDTPLSGAVVEHERCGPVAQIDVARAGSYRIRAQLNDVTLEETLELAPQGGERLVLRWPE